VAIGPDPKAAQVAFRRFGFGPRGGAFDLARAASDPRGFLKAELQQPAITRLDASTLPSTKIALQALFIDQQQRKAERRNMPPEGTMPLAASIASVSTGHADDPAQTMAASWPPDTSGKNNAPKSPEPPVAQKFLRADAMAALPIRFPRRGGPCRAARTFLVEPFLCVRGKGPRTYYRRLLRA
jgi:uncharacterized protein (DUF1800 family)